MSVDVTDPRSHSLKSPENDSRPVQFFVDDDSFVEELARLLALFEEARPEMDIKDMQGRVIEADIGPEGSLVVSRPPALMS